MGDNYRTYSWSYKDLVKLCIKSLDKFLAHATFKNVSYVTGTTNRQESWDEVTKHWHFCFFGLSLGVYLFVCFENILLQWLFKNSVKSQDFLATHRKKTSSKVPRFAAPDLNSVPFVPSQIVQAWLKVKCLFVPSLSSSACCLGILTPL